MGKLRGGEINTNFMRTKNLPSFTKNRNLITKQLYTAAGTYKRGGVIYCLEEWEKKIVIRRDLPCYFILTNHG